MSYYQFGPAWVQETVENGRLILRTYTDHPQTNPNAKLDSTTEFDAETRQTAQRFREGHVMADGHTHWGAWEPV